MLALQLGWMDRAAPICMPPPARSSINPWEKKEGLPASHLQRREDREWGCGATPPRCPCGEEEGALPDREHRARRQAAPLRSSGSSRLSVGWQQANCKEQALLPPPPPHPHTLAATEMLPTAAGRHGAEPLPQPKVLPGSPNHPLPLPTAEGRLRPLLFVLIKIIPV